MKPITVYLPDELLAQINAVIGRHKDMSAE